jgi:beta-lactam-binding protein with PASTA domain
MKDNKLIQYLLSKEFRAQLLLALAIFFGIILFFNITLRFFTRHNSTFAVPDFTGLTITEANEIADDYDLRIEIMDSVYNNLQKPGTVIEQEPKAKAKVKKNRRVFLVMNAMNAETVKMPNVVGVSLRQAIALLEATGLQAGNLRYVPDIATNNVLHQKYRGKDIAPGKIINKGSRIDMILGKSGDYEVAQLPDLTGLTKTEAEKKISQAYLNLGAAIYDKSVKTSIDSLHAFVYKQKPEADKQSASMGSIVDIWLTIDDDKVVTNSAEKNNE